MQHVFHHYWWFRDVNQTKIADQSARCIFNEIRWCKQSAIFVPQTNRVVYLWDRSFICYITEMVLRCAWGTCNSDERYPERMQGYRFIPFPKPKRDLEKCKRWIKACGRPHDQLNIHRINKHKAVCSKVRITNYLLPIWR